MNRPWSWVCNHIRDRSCIFRVRRPPSLPGIACPRRRTQALSRGSWIWLSATAGWVELNTWRTILTRCPYPLTSLLSFDHWKINLWKYKKIVTGIIIVDFVLFICVPLFYLLYHCMRQYIFDCSWSTDKMSKTCRSYCSWSWQIWSYLSYISELTNS